MKDKLDRAKLNLMIKAPFLASVSLQLHHVITTDVPTAGTDGKYIYYNPNFIKQLSLEELVTLLAHEIYHVALMHPVRLGNRDHTKFNYAGDYVINGILLEDGFKPLPDWLYDHKYTGLSTEEVYYLLPEDPVLNVPADIIYASEEDLEDNPSIKQDIENIIVQAVTNNSIHKMGGNVPGEILRTVEDLLNPKLNWRVALNRYVNAATDTDYNYSKPNRKYFPGYFLPTRYTKTINHITVAFDTSGSISQAQLTEFLSETKSIYNTFKPNTMTLLDCDSKLYNEYNVTPRSDFRQFKLEGGGGTSFIPVLEYAKEHKSNLLIYFTDLYAEVVTKDMGYDFSIVWVCNSNHEPQPYGETIYYGL